MNLSSLLIGVVIGIIGAFGAGFLKKAGEDLYSWFKGKIHPESVVEHNPQVIVHLHDDRGNNQADSSVHLVAAAIERVSQVSFGDIKKAIESAPPMQREHVAESYVGLKVEWDSYLKSARKKDNGNVSLLLSSGKGLMSFIRCEVAGEEYRELGILPEDTHIRISGEITEVSTFEVELTNVRLQIFPG